MSVPSLGPAYLTAINGYLVNIHNEHLTLSRVSAPILQAFAVVYSLFLEGSPQQSSPD